MSPCVLEMQHRMRPEIANLVSPSVYPVLKNHPKVSLYPKVKGMVKDVFFFDHQSEEKRERATASKLNVDEALFALELARYLLNQGYNRSKITIITTYNGQLRYLEKLIKQDPRYAALSCGDPLANPLTIKTVDEYQGEENDVIILSLVRSNLKNIVGFLDDEHRITVALSRARQGLYVLGDAELLRSSGGRLWKEVLDVLQAADSIGGALTLRCDKHGEERRITSVDDFFDLPGNGCPAQCLALISCGHQCQDFCHVTDPEHRAYVCMEKARKQRCKDPSHISTGPCFDSRCTSAVKKTFPCEHTAFVACHERDLVSCPRKILTLCQSCSLQKQVPCNMSTIAAPCYNNVLKQLRCGHSVKIECHVQNMKCTATCGKKLPCGHGTCGAPCHSGKCKTVNKCMQICNSVICNVHKSKCAKLCYQDCAKCDLKVSRTFPTCKHTLIGKCCDVKDKQCSVKIDARIPGCGHPVQVSCFQKKNMKAVKCKVIVESRVVLKCGHPLKLPCSEKKNSTSLTEKELCSKMFLCSSACKKVLSCGHVCEGTCKSCFSSRIHVPCKKPCTRELVCGHKCSGSCGEICPPCDKVCIFKCNHKQGQGVCSDAKCLCTERCKNSCPHRSCSLPCWKPCDVKRCDQPCKKMLPTCKHPCAGLCGEICPAVCEICNPIEFSTARTCNVLKNVTVSGERKPYQKRLFQLSPCGHIFHVGKLDQYFSSQLDLSPLCCPTCRMTVNTLNIRYLSILQRNHEIVHEIFSIACTRMPFSTDDIGCILKEIVETINGKKIKNKELLKVILSNAVALRKKLTPVAVSGHRYSRPMAYQEKFALFFAAEVLQELYFLSRKPHVLPNEELLLKLIRRLRCNDVLSPRECLEIQIVLDDFKLHLLSKSVNSLKSTIGRHNCKNGCDFNENMKILNRYLKENGVISDQIILAAAGVDKCLGLGLGPVLSDSRLYQYHPVLPEKNRWQLCSRFRHVVYNPNGNVIVASAACRECDGFNNNM